MNAYWDSYLDTWIMVWPDGTECVLYTPDEAEDEFQSYAWADEEEFLYDE
jgi:hypothetical protein